MDAAAVAAVTRSLLEVMISLSCLFWARLLLEILYVGPIEDKAYLTSNRTGRLLVG